MRADFRFGPPKAWSNENIRKKIMLHIRECGDCWEWHGSFNSQGTAQARLGGTTRGIRRVLYDMHLGKVDGYHVVGTCDNPKCVNPAHAKRMTLTSKMRKIGAMSMSLAKAIKITLDKRKKFGKITDEQRREMWAGTKSSHQWARELGISQKAAWKAMRPTAADMVNNPFAGLMR